MGAEQSSLTWGMMDRWSEAVTDRHTRLARRFARVEVRERVWRYLGGLLDRVARKNGWPLAEAIGEATPRGVQRLLNAATCAAPWSITWAIGQPACLSLTTLGS